MRKFPFVLTLLCGTSVPGLAQAPVVPSASGLASWDHLKVLPAHVQMHVSTDTGGSKCYLIAVDDEKLVCGRKNGSPKGEKVFPRAIVKNVKLTRYGLSTLGGLGIGLGTGAIVGVAVFRSTPNDFFGNFGQDIGRTFSVVLGGVAGLVVGGTTDMFRGPTVYQRM